MLLEIVGAKALAPFFGSSHFVWISQIMVTLASLSFGSYFAYKIEKKLNNDRKVAYSILYVAAAYIGFSTLFLNKIALSLIGFSLSTSALLASILLYFIPLSTISCSYSLLVSTKIKESKDPIYGKLSAIGTIGSILGTILFGYYLVKNFSNQSILVFSSFSLWLIAAINTLNHEKKPIKPIIYPIVFILTSGFLYTERTETKEEFPKLIEVLNTSFGELKVVETKETIDVYNNNIIQGNYYKKTKQSAHLFSYALSSLAVNNTKNLKSVFIMGLGLGLVPAELRRYGVEKIKSVEINEQFVDLAKKLSILEESNSDMEINDGRYSLMRSEEKFDCVIVDAFLVDNSPSHLNTKEFYQTISTKLNKNGTAVINSFGFFSPEAMTTVAIFNTLKSVFKEVKAYSTENANVFFVASNSKLEASGKYDQRNIPEELKPQLENLILSERTNFKGKSSMILTDSFNPIDSLDVESREKIRRSSLSALK